MIYAALIYIPFDQILASNWAIMWNASFFIFFLYLIFVDVRYGWFRKYGSGILLGLGAVLLPLWRRADIIKPNYEVITWPVGIIMLTIATPLFLYSLLVSLRDS